MKKKIDRRRTYKLVLDTETCPINKKLTTVLPSNMLAYDIGWVVTDRHGNIYEERSFLNKDIFIGEWDKMQSAYFADKIADYIVDLADGNIELLPFTEIFEIYMQDLIDYEIERVYAYNMRFDYGVLNETTTWTQTPTDFFPSNVEVCDIMKMATDIIKKQPNYIAFCNNNGFVCKNGRPRMTAEVLNRYLTNNLSFQESHTGLQDCLIEKDIMAYCYKQKKPMRELLFEQTP